MYITILATLFSNGEFNWPMGIVVLTIFGSSDNAPQPEPNY